MLHIVLLFVLLSGVQGMRLEDCPAKGWSANGDWYVNNQAKVPRCVLKCKEGYEPDRCNVLRRTNPDTWNREIPNCVKKSWIPWKTMAKAGVAVVAGSGAVAAAPVALSAAVFTAAGVAAGSIASRREQQSQPVAAFQSAGAAGLAVGTQAGLFSGVTAVTGGSFDILGRRILRS